MLALAAYSAGPEKTYIVEFTAEPAASVMARVPRADRVRTGDRRRGEIRAEQREILTRLAIRGRVLATTETIANAAIVSMTDAEAARIARQPGVSRVEPSVPVDLCVDRAVDVQRVRSAWELAGGPAKAGAGAKVAIVDSGIDVRHPAFQDPDLAAPEGYPKSDSESGLAFTNSKVIVHRNYEKMLDKDASPSYLDERGHGTNVASIAAGARHETPQGVFAGMAPKAWIGAYKVFPAGTGQTQSAVCFKATDDAVTDGMDVVNLSIGFTNYDYHYGVIGDAEKRAAALGVQVIYAAANDGPARGTLNIRPNLVTLSVGAATNSRFFGGRLRLDDGTDYPATTAEPPDTPRDPVAAELKSVAGVDPTGLACDPLPAGSFDGKIGLAIRGDKPGRCGITTVHTNLKNAGAVGVLIMSSAEIPEARGISAGAIPGMRIGNAHGTALLQRLAKGETLRATLEFAYLPQETDAGRIAGFSSRGPGADFAIKPDLSAVGEYIWNAAPGGKYGVGDGTSYSAPMVAGAMAVLKAARPGLSYEQYRSLLVNTTRPMDVPVMDAGAGLLDLEAALRASLAADPVSASFGVSRADFAAEREIIVSNLGDDDTVSLTVERMGEGPMPSISPNQIALAAGARQAVRLRLDAKAVPPGEYQGFLIVQGTRGSGRLRIPYWFAVSTGRTESLAVKGSLITAAPGALAENSLFFRITDRFGIPTTSDVDWELVSGSAIGLGLYNAGARERGMYEFDMRFPPKPGRSIFRFSSDGAAEEVWYTASGKPAERFLNPSWWRGFLGAVPIGQFNEYTLRLSNLGTSTLQVREFGPPNATVTVRASSLPLDIPPDGSVSVVVRYAPTATAEMAGWLVIRSNDPEMPGLGIWVTGRGVTPPDNPVPVLTSISPDNARAGSAGFTLTVTGSSFLSSSVVEWNGSARATTYVSASRLTAAITAADMAQAGTARVTVFNPAPKGGRSATLNFRIDATSPADTRIEVTPSTLDFGSVVIGQVKDLSFTVRSIGSAPLTLTALTIDNPRFTLVSPPATPITVNSGASASLVVRFAPSAAGAQMGKLIITSNAASQPALTVPLAGTGAVVSGPREIVLSVDDGTFERMVGYPNWNGEAFWVNRLTPERYPAMLTRIRIYFPAEGDIAPNTQISLVLGTHPSGTEDVIAPRMRPATGWVREVGKWVDVDVDGKLDAIESGDFIVGFYTSVDGGLKPMAQDTSKSAGKSYVSKDGVTYQKAERTGQDGNFLIRAVVTVGQ
jgi:hypothetical protein